LADASEGRAIARIVRGSYWRAADARVVVEAWRRSGRSLAAFAREHGVRPRRLVYWRDQLEAGQTGEAVAFHPVQVVPARTEAAAAAIEIRLGASCVVRVPAGVAMTDVRVVLSTLQELIQA
jgi:transposase-like protein